MKLNLKKIGFVGGALATGVAFKWVCDTTAKAVVMSQKDIASQRTDEEKYFFEECKKLEDEYETLLAREEDRANILFSDSKAAYRKAKEAADIVTDREMTMWNNGKAELQKEIEQLTEAVNVILREEQIRANDILKEDSAYQMLQEARKVLVEGEKSTDEIDKKIAERAKAVKDGVESLRSDGSRTWLSSEWQTMTSRWTTLLPAGLGRTKTLLRPTRQRQTTSSTRRKPRRLSSTTELTPRTILLRDTTTQNFVRKAFSHRSVSLLIREQHLASTSRPMDIPRGRLLPSA